MTEPASTERYTLISADCHAGASIEGYRGYLDPKYRDEFDAWRGRYKNPSQKLLASKKTKNWDSDERIRDLESEGVVAEVVFPNTVPPFFPTGVVLAPPPPDDELELRLAGIRAHNRWLAEFCEEVPDRRAGVGLIALNDVDEAIRDVEWIAEHGLRGGVLIPGVPDEAKHIAPLYAPEYDRLWAVCQDLDVILAQHSGSGSPSYGKYPASMAINVTEMPFYSKRGFTHLILGGVFERFPKLRYILTETGCSWAPSLLRQLDGLHAQMKLGATGEVQFSETGVLPEPPSFYAKRNCWYGASFPSTRDIAGRDYVGHDRICWGMDYPHFEGTYPFTRESLRLTFAEIDPPEVQAMLAENSAKLYGFDLEALRGYAEKVGLSREEIAQPLEKTPRGATSPVFWMR